MIKKSKTNKLNNTSSNDEYIQIKSNSLNNEDEIIIDIPKNAQKKQYKEILKLSMIKHIFSKYDKHALLNIVSESIDVAVSRFAVFVALFIFAIFFIFFLWIITKMSNQIPMSHFYNILSLIVFTILILFPAFLVIRSLKQLVYKIKKESCLNQKIKKQLAYYEKQKSKEEEWSEIMNNKKKEEEDAIKNFDDSVSSERKEKHPMYMIINILFIKFIYMFQKTSLLYQKKQELKKDKQYKIDNKKSQEHENDIANFLNLMELHNYDSAKKLADKHNWEMMIKNIELENHMNNVKKQMKQNKKDGNLVVN